MNEENKKIDSQTKKTEESLKVEVKKETGEEKIVDKQVTKKESQKIVLPDIRPGMVVRVHQKIKDIDNKGNARERIQIFEGTVLVCRGGKTAGATFTVRKKTVGGIWAEKIFPIYSPNVVKVEIVKIYKVRRAKLNYLRDSKKKLKQIKSQVISKRK